MPELVTLGSVPYNPYNTSFAEFALKGFQIGQASRMHADEMHQQDANRLQRQTEFAAELAQKGQDNAFRQVAFEHQVDEDNFRHIMEQERLQLSKDEINFNQTMAEKNFGLASRASSRADAEEARKKAEFESRDLAEEQRQRSALGQLKISEAQIDSALKGVDLAYASRMKDSALKTADEEANLKHSTAGWYDFKTENPNLDPELVKGRAASTQAALKSLEMLVDQYKGFQKELGESSSSGFTPAVTGGVLRGNVESLATISMNDPKKFLEKYNLFPENYSQLPGESQLKILKQIIPSIKDAYYDAGKDKDGNAIKLPPGATPGNTFSKQDIDSHKKWVDRIFALNGEMDNSRTVLRDAQKVTAEMIRRADEAAHKWRNQNAATSPTALPVLSPVQGALNGDASGVSRFPNGSTVPKKRWNGGNPTTDPHE